MVDCKISCTVLFVDRDSRNEEDEQKGELEEFYVSGLCSSGAAQSVSVKRELGCNWLHYTVFGRRFQIVLKLLQEGDCSTDSVSMCNLLMGHSCDRR